jgi:hypothetical protein
MLGVDVSALPPLSEAMKALQEGMDASVFNELGSSATVIESAKAHQAQRAQRNKNASSPI